MVVALELDVHVTVITQALEAQVQARDVSIHRPVALRPHAGRIVLEVRVVQQAAVGRCDPEFSRHVRYVHGHRLDVASLPPGPDFRPVGFLCRERAWPREALRQPQST